RAGGGLRWAPARGAARVAARTCAQRRGGRGGRAATARAAGACRCNPRGTVRAADRRGAHPAPRPRRARRGCLTIAGAASRAGTARSDDGSVEERAAGGAPAAARLGRARLGSRRLVLALEQAGVIGLRRRLRAVLRERGHVRAPSIRVAQAQPHGDRALLLLVECVAPASFAALDRDLVLLHDHGPDRSRAVLEAPLLERRAADAT